METQREKGFVFFAVCNPGAEEALHNEMKELRFFGLERQSGGVSFRGQPSEGWRAVLTLRVAVRVYRELGRFRVPDAAALYNGVFGLPWEKIISSVNTISVDAKVSESPTLTHSGFTALKVKDAIADALRERTGERPNVDTKDPDARIFVLVHRDRCIISLDLAGRSLHRRGYRQGSVEAPISECLSSAAVRYSEWDEKSPFLDPFCGSGTIMIEAAMKAARIMPGSLGSRYSFMRLPGFDEYRWEKMLKEAREGVNIPKKLIMIGSDIDPAAVEAAKANAGGAGVGEMIRFEVADAGDFSPKKGWGATIISNPPYGERLEDEESLIPLYNRFGRALISKCSGCAVHLFMTSQRLRKAMLLKPERYWPLTHGGLDARLYRFLVK
ncbi:RNA methyltransferase [bacterium]|nr:MAG: RNA methyltransferase [bacterium]